MTTLIGVLINVYSTIVPVVSVETEIEIVDPDGGDFIVDPVGSVFIIDPGA